MTDPRTPTSDPVAEPQTEAGRVLYDSLGKLPEQVRDRLRQFVLAIEAEARQQAHAAFAAQPWPDVGHTLGIAAAEAWAASGRAAPLMEPDEWDGFGLTLAAVLETKHGLGLTASPEPASPEAPGSGLDVERLAEALRRIVDHQGIWWGPAAGEDAELAKARDIAREYAAARPDGAEADASPASELEERHDA